MEYKLLEIETTAMTTPKIKLKEIQDGINEFAKEGWKVEHITPISNINGITGKLIITLSKEVS